MEGASPNTTDVGSIPLAIQSFLWRQTEPFFRQQLGKLYQASCVSFEHVLVENRLHGLPPSLYEAISNTPRRRLIEAALPHVMHCASVMLNNRNKLGHADKLGVPATKLLHTFHSILQESMETIHKSEERVILHEGDISNIQLFVFLFAPLANTIKESDLTFRLASGLKTWEALWNHEVPDLAAMSLIVNPQPLNSEEREKGKMSRDSSSSQDDTLGDCFNGFMRASSCNQVTTFDVAVLRCLFFSRWSEEGVLWGVTYLLKRLQPSAEHLFSKRRSTFWPRSKSLTGCKYSHSDDETDLNSLKLGASGNVQFSEMPSYEPDDKPSYEREEKRSFGFFTRFRFSERRRRSRVRSPVFSERSRHLIKLHSSKDFSLSPVSGPAESEEKDFKERRTSSISSKRSRFRRMPSVPVHSLNHLLKDNDEPPDYESLARQRDSVFLRRPTLEVHALEKSFQENGDGMPTSNLTISPPLERVLRASIGYNKEEFKNSVNRKKQRNSYFRQSNCDKELKANVLNRRWASDTCLSYSRDERVIGTEVTSSYVTSDGYFRSDVILQAVEVVVSRDPGVKIYDGCLQIIECIMRNVYLKDTKITKEKSQSSKERECEFTFSSPKDITKTPKKKDVIQFLNVIIKVVQAMGCIRHCSRYGHRGTAGERLRLKARSLLIDMYVHFEEIFREHVTDVVKYQTLKESTDLLHLLLTTCETEFNNTTVTGMEEKSEWMRCPLEKLSSEQKMKSAIAVGTFENFVQRCIDIQDDLYCAHSRALYRDVRQFIQYIKQNHGSIFNKLLLNVLLIPAKKRRQWKKNKEKIVREKSCEEKKVESMNEGHRSSRQRRGAVTLESSPLPSRANPLAAKSRPTLKSRFSLWTESSKEAESMSSNGLEMKSSRAGSVFGKLQSTWRKSKIDSCSSLNGDDLTDTTFSTSVNDKPRTTETRSFFNLIGKTVRKQMSEPLDTIVNEISCSKTTHEEEDNHQREKTNSQQFAVDENDICSGVKILRFLMESCPPGTVPEPKIMAAVLELESPVVCRAAFFLECAVFVHRCSHNDWPRWMTNGDSGISKSFLRAHRPCVRTIHKMQTNAGRLFYLWGEALGKHLEYMCTMESGTAFVLPSVRSDGEKIRLREKDQKEDFLRDYTVNNRSGTACPVALKMIASQVLYEITTFVRDVAPYHRKRKVLLSSTRSDGEEYSNGVASDSASVKIPSTPQKVPSKTRRKSISFLDDHDNNPTPQHPVQASSNYEKFGRKSAPESSLRGEFKSMPFHSPKFPPRSSLTQDYHTSSRRRSITSTVTVLGDLKENSPLLSESSAYIYTDGQATLKHDEEACKTYLKAGNKELPNAPSSNYLTVPSACIPSGMTGSSSFGSYAGISLGSCISLGGSSVAIDDGQSLLGLDNQGSMFLSNVSIASSHIESPQTPNPESRAENEIWINNIPWIPVMLTLANQQNFVCEHKHFCHSFCHRRLVRSARRLVHALSKVLDKVGSRKQMTFHDKKNMDGSKLYNEFVSRYLKTFASSLMNAPILVLTKSATLLSDEMFFDVRSLCWEMILSNNKDISRAAAVLFLLCAIKTPHQVYAIIMTEFMHQDAKLRLDAILKFQILWECRHSVWTRTQEGASKIFKISPAGVNYTLPKEPIGTKHVQVPDAPWLPREGSLEEMLIAQSTSAPENSALLTTDTTAHQKEKQMKQAIKREEEAGAEARARFRLSDIPVSKLFAAEIHKTPLITKEEDESENLVSSNRFSSQATSICSSSHSFKDTKLSDPRPSSRQLGRPSKRDNDTGDHNDQQSNRDSNSARSSSSVFPSCIAACIPVMVNLCKDTELSMNYFSVGEMAQNTLESCLIEDPSLFLSHIFEKVSGKDSGGQLEMTNILRKLPLLLGRLSPHVAYTIFVNMLGIILKAVRSSSQGFEENMIACIGVLASVAPYVEGLEFKSLKMAFRKEQSDLQLLITSGLPGPKKLTIWNNSDYYMPILVDVNEESTFENVLLDAMNQNDIPITDRHKYQLVDRRFNRINCPHAYVRDFYSFNKKVYPELTLIEMDPEKAECSIKSRSILTQLEEINKLRFTLSVLINKKTSEERRLNASFLLEEFLRLKCFPRKAIAAPFSLFVGNRGKQIFDIDMMQKCWWIELISTVLSSLPDEFPWGEELLLFLHVWNAALVLHAEQVPVLRRYCAAVIDAAVHMNHQFIKQGYSLVLPTILEVYSQHYKMPSVRICLEFLCKQLHIIHRHPFVLELLASAAPILAAYSGATTEARSSSLSPDKFFCLLKSLDREYAEDNIQVLELVKSEQPLQSLDFCYKNDSCALGIIDYLRLCVTVIACQPDSGRTLQMLTVFDKILPCYLQELHDKTKEMRTTSHEIKALKEIDVCIRALLTSLECLTRNLTHPNTPHQTTHKVFYREGSQCGATRMLNSQRSRNDNEIVMEEGGLLEDSQDRLRTITKEFIAARDLVLNICSNYFVHTKKRLRHLEITSAQNTELLNDKSHTRLADIAQSLLKLLAEESFSVHCPGLLTYLTEMIPIVDWSEENVRGALFLILKRLDRLFIKISSMPEISRQNLNWNDFGLIAEGLSKLISNQPIVSVIPHLKSIVTINLAMLIGSSALMEEESSPRGQSITDTALPKTFVPTIIRLTLQHMNSLKDSVSLEDVVRQFTHGKRDYVILNFFVPLCVNVVCMQSGSKDLQMNGTGSLPFRESDVMYMFDYAFEILAKDSVSLTNNISQLLMFASPVSHKRTSLSHQVSLLLIRVLITCFHNHLHRHWFKIASKIKQVVLQRSGNSDVWCFLDVIMSLKTPLVLYLTPFVLIRVSQSSAEKAQIADIKENLRNKLTNINFKEIHLPSLTIVYENEVSRLKAEIASNLPGSRPTEREQKEGRTRSFRHPILSGTFTRKKSFRHDENASPQKHKTPPSGDSSQIHIPSSPSKQQQKKQSSGNELIITQEKVNAKVDGLARKSTEKGKLHRRWTQKVTGSKANSSKLSRKRHSVGGADNAAVTEENKRMDSIIETTSTSDFSTVPEIKIDVFQTPCQERKYIEALTNDKVEDIVLQNEAADMPNTGKSRLGSTTEDSKNLIRVESYPSTKKGEKHKSHESLTESKSPRGFLTRRKNRTLNKGSSVDEKISTDVNPSKSKDTRKRIFSTDNNAITFRITEPTPPVERRASTISLGGHGSPTNRKVFSSNNIEMSDRSPQPEEFSSDKKFNRERNAEKRLSPVDEISL